MIMYRQNKYLTSYDLTPNPEADGDNMLSPTAPMTLVSHLTHRQLPTTTV